MSSIDPNPVLRFWLARFEGQTGFLVVASAWRTKKAPKDMKHSYFSPDQLGGAAEWAVTESNRGREVYGMANLQNRKSAKKEDAGPSRWLWADLDTAPLDRVFDLVGEPTEVLTTSPGSRQAWWRLDRPLPPDEYEALNRRICRLTGADAAWNRARLMRLPGTANRKRGGCEVYVSHADSGKTYSPEALWDRMGPEDVEGRRGPGKATVVPFLDLGDQMTSPMPDMSRLPAQAMNLLDLSRLPAHLLKEDGPDRSKVIQAAAFRFRSAGYSYAEFARVLLDPTTPAGGKLRERGPDWASQELARVWSKADVSAPRRGPDMTPYRDALERARLAGEFHGVRGENQRKAMLALADKCEQLGKPVVELSARAWADLIGIRHETLIGYYSDPRFNRWARRVDERRGRSPRALAWEPVIPPGFDTNHRPHRGDTPLGRAAVSPSNTVGASCVVLGEGTARSHDAFRAKGLGPRAGLLYGLLRSGITREEQLVEQYGTDIRNVRRQLRRLEGYGLAVETGPRTWTWGEADLDLVAEELGVAGTGLRQSQRHKTERCNFRRARAEVLGLPIPDEQSESLGCDPNGSEIVDKVTAPPTAVIVLPSVRRRGQRPPTRSRARIGLQAGPPKAPRGISPLPPAALRLRREPPRLPGHTRRLIA